MEEGFILIIDNLCVHYESMAVIEDFSMKLKKGEKVLITGPNGCGKTTLLKTILGSVKRKSGDIFIQSGVLPSYCKQDFPNPDFVICALEIVKMGLYRVPKPLRDYQLDKAMTLTGCKDLSDRVFSTLSGGERQRISLARCLAQNSDLILLDEPSSFLDRESKDSFIEILKNLPENVSVLAVTHDKDVIERLSWRQICLKGESK